MDDISERQQQGGKVMVKSVPPHHTYAHLHAAGKQSVVQYEPISLHNQRGQTQYVPVELQSAPHTYDSLSRQPPAADNAYHTPKVLSSSGLREPSYIPVQAQQSSNAPGLYSVPHARPVLNLQGLDHSTTNEEEEDVMEFK